MKPHNLPTFTSFMSLNERSANVKNRRAFVQPAGPSTPSLFNSLLYVSVLEWRGGTEREGRD